ncbi:hypothetical protein HWV62_5369 [Athelia sp. TMB]|nr:hypothetical protein HWV62_5369 [Athelia sp. TMB]
MSRRSRGSTPTSRGSTPTSRSLTPTSRGSTPTSRGFAPTTRGSTPTTRGSTRVNRGSAHASLARTQTSRASTPTSRGSAPASRAGTQTSRASTSTDPESTQTRNDNPDDEITLLKLASEIPLDDFPVCKGVASVTLRIINAVKSINDTQNFQTSRKEWASVGQVVQTTAINLIQSLFNADSRDIAQVKGESKYILMMLNRFGAEIEKTQREYPPGRIRPASKDQKLTADMKADVDRVWVFLRIRQANTETISPKELLSRIIEKYRDIAQAQRSSPDKSPIPWAQNPPAPENIDDSTISPAAIVFNTSHVSGGKIVNLAGNSTGKISGGTVMNVAGNSTTIIQFVAATLEAVYAKGASWNPTLVCLPGTRKKILSEIYEWSRTLDSQNILWLKGVAGSGKSAVTHRIAEMLQDEGRLAAAFFFSRDNVSLSNPKLLVTTIALDIASRDTAIAEDISSVLKNEPALASAHILRQFEVLIAGPLRRRGRKLPFIVVIDGLDEGIHGDTDTSLLDILRNAVPRLTSYLRFLITSRPTNIITRALSQQEHVKSLVIDTHSIDNWNDIALYVDAQRQEDATCNTIGLNEVDEALVSDLKSLSEGLFIWIVTIFNYLRSAYKPRDKLDALLSKSAGQNLPTHKKMDNLYAIILEDIGDWDDPDFAGDYQTALGAVMTVKRPLSLAAFKALHSGGSFAGGAFPEAVIKLLGSVLVGFDRPEDPIRMIHISFRDFVTGRANDSEHTCKFYISENEHSGKLAELCLQTMVREFSAAPISGTGYLAEDLDTFSIIPKVTGVSEQLLYGCDSSIEHIGDVEIPTASLIAEMQKFLPNHGQIWIEIVSSISVFRGSLAFFHWLEARAPILRGLCDDEAHALTLWRLSFRLDNIGRLGEALTAIQESVDLFQALAAEKPAVFNANLALSLMNMSKYLNGFGRSEEALRAVQNAMVLLRALAAKKPAVFNANLAKSLVYISIYSFNLDRREEACTASQESLDLLRALVAERPAEFNADLAMSLFNISICFAALDRSEDAVAAIREAVDLYRDLATERPMAYNTYFARALKRLSKLLSNRGHNLKAEARLVSQELDHLKI